MKLALGEEENAGASNKHGLTFGAAKPGPVLKC